MWIGEPTQLIHQLVVGWAGLQIFWLTIKWVGLGSFIYNLAHDEPTCVSQLGSL